MRSRHSSLALWFTLATVPLALAQNPPTSPATGGRGNQNAPRGRSITLGDITSFDVKDNIATVSAGADQVRVIFYRNDIVRLWLGPDGHFTDAQPNAADAQIVVYRGAPIPLRHATPATITASKAPQWFCEFTGVRCALPCSTRLTPP